MSYPRFDDILFSFFRVIYVMSMTSNVYFHHWMKCFLINQGGVCDIFPITLVIYETSKTLRIMRPGENCFQSVEGLSGSWNKYIVVSNMYLLLVFSILHLSFASLLPPPQFLTQFAEEHDRSSIVICIPTAMNTKLIHEHRMQMAR